MNALSTVVRSDAYYTAEYVTARLEEAGKALLSIPMATRPRGFKSGMPEVVLTAWEAEQAEIWMKELGEDPEMRLVRPDSACISRMDEALFWLLLIPQDRLLLRRIVGRRMLINPRNDRLIWSWRRLGRHFSVSDKTAERWHAQGVDIICTALNRQAG